MTLIDDFCSEFDGHYVKRLREHFDDEKDVQRLKLSINNCRYNRYIATPKVLWQLRPLINADKFDEYMQYSIDNAKYDLDQNSRIIEEWKAFNHGMDRQTYRKELRKKYLARAVEMGL